MKMNTLNNPVQPKNAIGFPSREADLDVLPGFKNPPRGYGQIPFYWWAGEELNKDRLIWQLDKLKEKGVTGLQINYPHYASMPDTGEEGWPTCPGEPEVFSHKWWELWSWYVEEVKKRDMAVGLSDYTIHWEKSHYYMDKIAMSPDVRGTKLNSDKAILNTGEEYNLVNVNDFISITAYKAINEQIKSETCIDLKSLCDETGLNWKAPHGQWMVISIWGTSTELDPMNPKIGHAIVEHFLKPFEDRNPGESGKALNYFFQDEERIRGEERFPWNSEFADYFKRKKGYDIVPFLPALFQDIGDISPKIRLDYHDVKSELIGNGYFKPIFEWCWEHGMTFGSDNNGRGTDPAAYGDYFRTQRFITAPGNDTPGRNSDLIKVKVNSSIAHLYQRPRIWLEGYHSSGWGTTLESITIPTSENFVFGANILNLHGLYYSTQGGWWEWAPPDFHFRMPYWEHEGVWLKYYERLSYLMSQGYHRCDAAIIYPVSALEANLYLEDENGRVLNAGTKSVDIAFDTGRKIASKGIDFDFIDFESVENCNIEDCKLKIAGEEYKVLILPGMQAIRKKTVKKILGFYRAGGVVISIGVLPSESDTVGRNDEELDEIIKEIFGKTASEAREFEETIKNVNSNGGIGIYAPENADMSDIISETIKRDFIPLSEQKTGYVNHRKAGVRDVYMVRNVPPESECFFRGKGKVEFWNPWDGSTRPIYTFRPVEGGTIVRMPMENYQDNIIVFTPGQAGGYVEESSLDTASIFKGVAKPAQKIEIDGPWEFELKPTLDNQWGDFRMPPAKEFISAEARFFTYMEENEPDKATYKKEYEVPPGKRVTYSRGTSFWRIIPADVYDENEFVNEIISAKTINSNTVINDGINNAVAMEYSYSIRWGITDSSVEEQNWHHGLNGIVPNEFLILEPHKHTYYWTTVYAPKGSEGRMLTGSIKPDKVWINGVLQSVDSNIKLTEGSNPILLKYSNTDMNAKRAYFIIEDTSINGAFEKYPLAMDWFVKPDIYKFDAFPQDKPHYGVYWFESPLGLNSMKITAYGNIEVWVEGEQAHIAFMGKTVYGARQYEVTVKNPSKNGAKVKIRIEHEKGVYQGAAIPEPIKLDCTVGLVELGDWSQMGILESYSGGACYRKSISVSQIGEGDRVVLNLGKIAATAEVIVNGQTAGILVCPPWKLDISGLVKNGENIVEILVYNTLSNHYSTIPSRYSNFPQDAVSGLIGPVSIEVIRDIGTGS